LFSNPFSLCSVSFGMLKNDIIRNGEWDQISGACHVKGRNKTAMCCLKED
jgi:hypothetical protein